MHIMLNNECYKNIISKSFILFSPNTLFATTMWLPSLETPMDRGHFMPTSKLLTTSPCVVTSTTVPVFELAIYNVPCGPQHMPSGRDIRPSVNCVHVPEPIWYICVFNFMCDYHNFSKWNIGTVTVINPQRHIWECHWIKVGLVAVQVNYSCMYRILTRPYYKPLCFIGTNGVDIGWRLYCLDQSDVRAFVNSQQSYVSFTAIESVYLQTTYSRMSFTSL